VARITVSHEEGKGHTAIRGTDTHSKARYLAASSGLPQDS